nr:apolipoprotein F isoform X1 [Pogona vitticeps]
MCQHLPVKRHVAIGSADKTGCIYRHEIATALHSHPEVLYTHLCSTEQGAKYQSNMYLPSPMAVFAFFGLLMFQGLDGHLLSMANPKETELRAHQSTSEYRPGALHSLFRSFNPKSPQLQLPQKGVSCRDLMPEALGGFAKVPPIAQNFIRAAFSLALQSAGCPSHAETLILQLSKELGEVDTEHLLVTMAGALGTPSPSHENKSSVALQFNLDQLAPTQAWHCRGLRQVNGTLLHGRAYRVYKDFLSAALACRHLGDLCAGVASNGTSSFQVVARDGSFFLPHHGAHSWLHQCHGLARVQRSSPEDCLSEKEQQVYEVLSWVPVVSTYYNLGTSVYYATQGCTDLAKERVLEGAIDLSYDALMGMTGGVGGGAALGISAMLKPGYKVGIYRLIDYFNQEKEEPSPPPTTSHHHLDVPQL